MGDMNLNPDSTTYGGPYARAAQIYRAAGWDGVLPLGSRPGMKFPPPGNWTGHGAAYPSGSDIHAWTETHGDRNIGLRMPPGVIGLDVDHYGNKTGADTLAALTERFGPLPDTWVSTARPAPSGIRFYRVPDFFDGTSANWPGEAGKFIEIIQPGHRYAVVWPSTNPEAAGHEYGWHFQHGTEYGDAVVYPPKPETLPFLPPPWSSGLALPYARVDKVTLGSEPLAAYWDSIR